MGSSDSKVPVPIPRWMADSVTPGAFADADNRMLEVLDGHAQIGHNGGRDGYAADDRCGMILAAQR